MFDEMFDEMLLLLPPYVVSLLLSGSDQVQLGPEVLPRVYRPAAGRLLHLHHPAQGIRRLELSTNLREVFTDPEEVLAWCINCDIASRSFNNEKAI